MRSSIANPQSWSEQAPGGELVRRGGRTATSAGYRAAQRRREILWTWLSLLVLVICWDAAARLDEKLSAPRPRSTHAAQFEEKPAQKALIPVSARPTVN